MKISSATTRMNPASSRSCRVSTVWRSGRRPPPPAVAERRDRTRVRGSSSSSKKDKRESPHAPVALTDELPAVAGPTLAMGRYRLGARLGAGGFGTVYAARDERLGRPVAVKVIPADGPSPERAQREARAVARLDHEAIVALVDALAHAHERGVIHRDVKPQNVIVPDDAGSRRGAAKLTDFGVAHLAGEDALTRTGDVVGTLAYMAPEQAAGQPVDERADLYALGLVLYEALAGRNPVAAGSPGAPARRIGTRLPPLASARPDLPPDLCAALDRAVAADPVARGGLDDLFDACAHAI